MLGHSVKRSNKHIPSLRAFYFVHFSCKLFLYSLPEQYMVRKYNIAYKVYPLFCRENPDVILYLKIYSIKPFLYYVINGPQIFLI